MERRTLFVIMPFGVRPLPSGEDHDFDGLYRGVLRPVAEDAGWQVIRVDEVVETGVVTDQAFRLLQSADLVVADISSPNSNVHYELGIRHAISPGGTVLVAARDTVLPFDLAHQRVLFYDRDYSRDDAFRSAYAAAMMSDREHGTNPVRASLAELGVVVHPEVDRVAFQREFELKVDRASNVEQLVAVWHWVRPFRSPPTSGLMSLAKRLAEAREFDTAVAVLDAAFPAAQRDYEVHRQRGFYLRKSNRLDEAERAFREALRLNPADPETIGMLGGALKRQRRYDEALDYYRRGAELVPNTLYLPVARAGMEVVASPQDHSLGIELYRDLRDRIQREPTYVGDSWADLVLAEAEFALGGPGAARQHAADAIRNGAGPLDLQSAAEQIELLGSVGLHPDDSDELRLHLLTPSRARAVTATEQLSASAPGANALPRRHLIFHFSDVHFGSVNHDGETVNMHRFYDGENSRRLSLDLTDEITGALDRAQCQVDAAMIVLSGDLAYTATWDEFKLVQSFLDELCQNVGLSAEQVVIVPGNHDVDWHTSKGDRTKRFDNYLSFVRNYYGDSIFRKIFPRVTWDFTVTTDRPVPSDIVSFHSEPGVTFVGLNSCVFEDHQDHYGFVGQRQLEKGAELLRTDPHPDNIRIAVMHHHLHPYPERLEDRGGKEIWQDLSTIRDAGMVEQRLEHLGFSLVLHGHKHKPQLRETLVRDGVSTIDNIRPLIVSGCGSTGVSSIGMAPGEANHYAIIRLLTQHRSKGSDFVRVEWRELSHRAGAVWSTNPEPWTVQG